MDHCSNSPEEKLVPSKLRNSRVIIFSTNFLVSRFFALVDVSFSDLLTMYVIECFKLIR